MTDLHGDLIKGVGVVAYVDDLPRLADLEAVALDVDFGVVHHAGDLDVQVAHPRRHVLVALDGRLH